MRRLSAAAGYAPPGFFTGGNDNNGTPPTRYIVQKPIVRVIGGPLANPPTGAEPILVENQLLYEWGGRLFVRVDFGELSAQDPRRTTPVEVTLYGPVLPRSGIQQQPPACGAGGPRHRDANRAAGGIGAFLRLRQPRAPGRAGAESDDARDRGC